MKRTIQDFFDYRGPEAPPNRRERREMECIKSTFTGQGDIYRLLNEQLNTIHMRAAAIITIVGVVVTVTGFSGRLIAGTSTLAQWLIVSGLAFTILAGATTLFFVMPVRWITTYMAIGLDQWMLVAIRRRDRKTRAHRVATVLLILGIALYGSSIALMLLNPFAYEVANAR
jgi:hypothetical protein